MAQRGVEFNLKLEYYRENEIICKTGLSCESTASVGRFDLRNKVFSKIIVTLPL